MYWSTIFMMGSFVFSAARISSRTRPSVVSWPARVTLISRTPVRFCVHGQRFASDGGLVERTLSTHNHFVRGNIIARTNANEITDDQIARGYFLLALRCDAS